MTAPEVSIQEHHSCYLLECHAAEGALDFLFSSIAAHPEHLVWVPSLRRRAGSRRRVPLFSLERPELGPRHAHRTTQRVSKEGKKIRTLLGFGSYQRAEAARSSGHARPPQPSGGGAELPVKPGAIRPWGRRRPTSRRGGFVASANSGGGEARRGGPGRGGARPTKCVGGGHEGGRRRDRV